MLNRIYINKVHFPITTLGFGKRVGIWTQGCSIHCSGCISRDTWSFDPDKAIAVTQLVAALRPWLARADGVTLSGGEPFDQPDALAQLLDQLRQNHRGDILVYSGYPSPHLARRFGHILPKIDVLISEPYQPESGTSLIWRGSDNQHIALLSPLARSRYPADLDRRPWGTQRRLDLATDGDTVWLAGIPCPGEMPRVKASLARLGIACSSSDDPSMLIRA